MISAVGTSASALAAAYEALYDELLV